MQRTATKLLLKSYRTKELKSQLCRTNAWRGTETFAVQNTAFATTGEVPDHQGSQKQSFL